MSAFSPPNPGTRPVLVLAPHPDDESLGCGGTIRLLTSSGVPVEVVYLTHGELGAEVPENVGAAGAAQLAEVRTREALAACRILGVAQVDFLNGRDSQLTVEPHLVEALVRRLAATEYQRVFCPWLRERHPDHAATFEIYRQALAQGKPLDTWLYEVWTPLPANVFVPIDGTIQDKLAAIQAHESQLACLNYLSAFQGLAAYRSLFCPPSQYAEAFRVCAREAVLNHKLDG
jgi:LmbE family N-acetylglucosaminyl deacetylase